MRQRIGLAQALINDPELVILDEPTSGLDPLGTRWMKDLILDLRNQGKTVLMCSHRLDDVQDVCDRIAILYDGELQEFGSVKKLLEDAQRVRIAGQRRRHERRAEARPGGGHPAARRDDRDVRPPDDDAGRSVPANRRGEQGPPGPALSAGGRGRPKRRSRQSHGHEITRARSLGVISSIVSPLGILVLEREPLKYSDCRR